MKEHYLKTVQPFFDDVKNGRKPFEVRFNDRDYQVGDILHLQEFVPPETYTGQEIIKEATYILDDPQFCKEGYVVIGFPDEKQVPKEPTDEAGDNVLWFGCPACKGEIFLYDHHCRCGQALKWSD